MAGKAGFRGSGGASIIIPDPVDAAPVDFPPCPAIDLLLSNAGEGCVWPFPKLPGVEFIPNHVNIEFDPDGGSSRVLFYVGTLGGCDPETGGWFYDDESNPTVIALCPRSCGDFLSAPAARLTLVQGCSGPRLPR